MSISVQELRTACGDGTTWADVDAKRGPMAVVTPEAVLALVEVVGAALAVPWDEVGVVGEDDTVGEDESREVSAVYAKVDALRSMLARFEVQP